MRKIAEIMCKIAEVMRKVAEVMRKVAEVMCLSKVYFCEVYPTCVSPKLCEFINPCLCHCIFLFIFQSVFFKSVDFQSVYIQSVFVQNLPDLRVS